MMFSFYLQQVQTTDKHEQHRETLEIGKSQQNKHTLNTSKHNLDWPMPKSLKSTAVQYLSFSLFVWLPMCLLLDQHWTKLMGE